MSKRRNDRFVWNSYGKNRRQELESIAHKFNRKIKKAIDSETTSAQFLPDTINLREIEKNPHKYFETVQDFNNFVKEKKRFLKEGAEETVTNSNGITKTKYEIEQMKLDYQRNNARKKKRHEELAQKDIMNKGKPESMNMALYGSNDLNRYHEKKFDFNKVKNEMEWKSMQETVRNQLRSNYPKEEMQEILENYYTGLYNVGFNNADELVDLIESVGLETAFLTVISDVTIGFDFIYDESDREIKEKQLMENWTAIAKSGE